VEGKGSAGSKGGALAAEEPSRAGGARAGSVCVLGAKAAWVVEGR